MRKAVLSVMLIIGVAAASTALAGAPAVTAQPAAMNHGEFAQMLLQTLATRQAPELAPAIALQRAQNLGLMPVEWRAEDAMTQRELGQVLESAQVANTAETPEGTLSRPVVQKLLNGEADQLRQRASKNLGQPMHTMGPSTHTISISDF